MPTQKHPPDGYQPIKKIYTSLPADLYVRVKAAAKEMQLPVSMYIRWLLHRTVPVIPVATPKEEN